MADSDLKDIFNAAAGQPDQADSLKNDQKDIKDIFQQAHDSPSADEISAQAQNSEPQGMLSKGLDFAKNLPMSAIDLIPGMQQKREQIQANRATPEYQNAPSGLPGVTQGQEDQNMQQAGQNDLNDPGMGLIGATSESSLLDLAKMVPGLSSKLTSMAPSLETAGSKMAQEAMGMNSAKDLTSEYNPMTGQSQRGSDIIKGTGTTALDQGVLEGGSKNWYDNALDALQTSYKKLGPMFQSVQPKIDANLDQMLSNVGPLTTKTPDIMQDIFDSVPTSSQRNLIVRKLGQQYSQYEQKMAAADGNLQALNEIKKELTTAAQNLSPQIYNNGSAKAEADLYKRLGGAVRQQIEDLANAAQDGAGDQIHQVNKTIGNLSNMLPTLQKTTRGGLPTTTKDVAQMLVGPVESGAAKMLNAASKVVQTPIGDIAQKAIPAVAKTVSNNPASQLFTMNNPNPVQSDSGHIVRTLSNATNDSLKDVAIKFQKNPTLKSCGDMLSKAIDTNDNDAKNRAIFCAAQIPQARALISPSGEE